MLKWHFWVEQLLWFDSPYLSYYNVLPMIAEIFVHVVVVRMIGIFSSVVERSTSLHTTAPQSQDLIVSITGRPPLFLVAIILVVKRFQVMNCKASRLKSFWSAACDYSNIKTNFECRNNPQSKRTLYGRDKNVVESQLPSEGAHANVVRHIESAASGFQPIRSHCAPHLLQCRVVDHHRLIPPAGFYFLAVIPTP